MKKLFIHFSFIGLLFGVIRAAENLAIGKTACHQTESFDDNNQSTLENMFDKKEVDEKNLLSLSVKKIWNTRLKPFITSDKFLVSAISIFFLSQISTFSHIFEDYLRSSFKINGKENLIKNTIGLVIAFFGISVLFPLKSLATFEN